MQHFTPKNRNCFHLLYIQFNLSVTPQGQVSDYPPVCGDLVTEMDREPQAGREKARALPRSGHRGWLTHTLLQARQQSSQLQAASPRPVPQGCGQPAVASSASLPGSVAAPATLSRIM